MALEIHQEKCPVEWKLMLLKIGERKRESMVNAYDGDLIFQQSLFEPCRDPGPRPVLARAGGRLHFNRRRLLVCHINTQP